MTGKREALCWGGGSGDRRLLAMYVSAELLKSSFLYPCFESGRLETDMYFGRKFGTRTLLVLTGITKESDLKDDLPPEMTPELYTDSIADLLQCVQ